MDGSYIKLYRSMLDWEWYSDINTKVLFLHMLLKANWRDKEWQGIVVERGQFVSSYSKLSEETGLTIAQVRTALKRLISTGEITHKAQSKYGLFTVINYDRYQAYDSQDNSQTTLTQQSDNSQVATTKNNKNNKKEKKDNSDACKEVIEYLNLKSGKAFTPTNAMTIKHINGRLKDGYTIDDMKKVIDTKVSEWKNTDYEKYIRPDTLFRPSKFENYVNQTNNTYSNESEEYRLVMCFESFRIKIDDKFNMGNKNNACNYFNRLISNGRSAKEIYAVMTKLFKSNNAFIIKKYKTVKEFCEGFSDLYTDLKIDYEKGETNNG